MKVLCVDVAKNEYEGKTTCWVVLTKVAKYLKNDKSKLFHFNVKKESKNAMIIQTGFDKAVNPEMYEKCSAILPGSLCELEYGVNDNDLLNNHLNNLVQRYVKHKYNF